MNKTSKFEELIEKHRLWIGGILILAIVGGSAILIWRENYAKPKLEDRIAVLEDKIGQLEAKINEYQVSSIKYQAGEQPSQQTAPEQGQVVGTSSRPASSISKDVAGQRATGKININTATATELDVLPGIGPAKAKAIIDYRNSKGGFKSIDELDNVSGIGQATIEKFKEQITI